MRRSVLLVGAIVLVDTIFYAALAPLLPDLEHEFGLSKGGAGLLVAVYALATLLASLPAGWLVARVGPRPVLVGGLLVMVAAGLLFAFADTVAVLGVSRFVQGIGGACSWTAGLAFLIQQAPADQRGRVLGAAFGAGIFGAQLGPVLGAAAEQFGRDVAFTAMAGVGVVLLVGALGLPGGRQEVPADVEPTPVTRALRDRRLLSALWITLLPALSFGVVEVIVPLRLDHLGATGSAIAAIFFVGALVEAVISPLTGRWADRHGMRGPLRLGLLGSALTVVLLTFPADAAALGILFVVASGTLGLLWTPGGNLVSLQADRLRLDQGYAMAANNIGWAGGVAAGSALAGLLGQLAGDWLPYCLLSATCLLTARAYWAGRQVPPLPSPP